MSRQDAVIWQNAVTFIVSPFFTGRNNEWRNEWIHDTFMTKVTPTVTNGTHSGAARVPRSAVEALPCFPWTDTRAYADHIAGHMHPFICSREGFLLIISLGLQSTNHPLMIMGISALLYYLLYNRKRHKFIVTSFFPTGSSGLILRATQSTDESVTLKARYTCVWPHEKDHLSFSIPGTPICACARLCSTYTQYIIVNRRHLIGKLDAWLSENYRTLVSVCSRAPPPWVPSH